MATNYNGNPDATSNLTGWVRTGGGTLTSTSEGARWTATAGSYGSRYLTITCTAGSPPLERYYTTSGIKIRRNTASSGKPSAIRLVPDETYGIFSDAWIDLVDLPVGQWVSLQNTTPAYRSGASTSESLKVIIYADLDGKAMDLTITHVDVHQRDDAPAGVVIDSNDVDFTWTQADNSFAATFTRAPSNEAVSKVTWAWGDGTANTAGAAAGARTSPTAYVKKNPVTHTFPARGRYNVTFTGSNFGWSADANAAFCNDTTAISTTKVVTVPMGPFTADYTYQASYLSIDVDASPSVSPSNDPIDLYTWSWGDGTTSTGKQQSHTYAQAGTYAVSLTISTTATQRSHIATKSINLVAPPSATNYFTVSKKLLQASFVPSIQDGSSYLWDFGDGNSSTLKQPVHVYSQAGTYSVGLTVNGTLTTSQPLTVTDVYTPIGKLNDSLRLEVAVPQPAGSIYNRLRNPDGVQGAFGWITPVSGSTVIGSSTSDQPKDKTVPGAKLIYTSSGTSTQVFYSESVPVVAGQYVGAQFVCPYVDGFYRVCVEALNASGAIVGTSTQTGYLSALGTSQRTVGYLLPAGTTKARIRINHYSNTSAGVPAAGKILQLRHVMLATASTAAALTTNPYIEYQNWLNVLGPTASINIDREALNVGTFSALITDSELDPATSSTIRPGQAVRLRATIADAIGNAVTESIYTGTLTDAQVSYTGKGSYTAKDTRISLTAVDNVSRLASTPQPNGVALIAELPEILETSAVPYQINGSSGQIPVAQIVTINDNASTLDQVAITRDSNAGYAFIDRDNVFIANDPVNMSTAPVTIIDEEAYSGINATFTTSECMNSVSIKWLNTTMVEGEPETVENLYGPYENAASIVEWGLHPVQYTMQGTETPLNIAAKAQAILNANAVPVRHINSVTIPIRYKEDLNYGKALLDLYDLVQLNYARTGTSELVRITGIKHTITAQKWLMTLEFGVNGAVAAPQVVAAPPASSTPATPSAPTLVGFSAYINVSHNLPTSGHNQVSGYTEDYDTANSFNPTTGLYVVPENGIYAISASVFFNTNTTGRRFIQIEAGTNTVGTNSSLTRSEVSTAAGYVGPNVYRELTLTAGTTLRLSAYQTSGAALAARGDFSPTCFTVRKIA